MGCGKSGSKREAYINTILPQEIRKKKNQINNLPLCLKQLEKEEQKTPKFDHNDQSRNK